MLVFGQDQCRRKSCREIPHRARGVQGHTLVKHVLVFRFHVRIRECNVFFGFRKNGGGSRARIHVRHRNFI